MKIIDLQNNRDILSKTIFLLKEIYNNSNILIGNFGYIVIPYDKNQYITKLFINREFYEKEFNNYKLLKNNNILLPDIEKLGLIEIGGFIFFGIKLSNVRKIKDRYKQMELIPFDKMGIFLSMLHSIGFESGKTLLHGNLHESNFFEDIVGNLGIFDLVSMFYGNIEYDFSNIYINSMYNEQFIINILKYYKFNNYFDWNKMYKFTLIKIIEKIKLNQPVRDEGNDGLKLAYFRIKQKLGNIT